MSFRQSIAVAGCLWALCCGGAWAAEGDVIGIVVMHDDQTLQVQLDIRRPGARRVEHSAFDLTKDDPRYEAMLQRVGGLKPRQQKLLYEQAEPVPVK